MPDATVVRRVEVTSFRMERHCSKCRKHILFWPDHAQYVYVWPDGRELCDECHLTARSEGSKPGGGGIPSSGV